MNKRFAERRNDNRECESVENGETMNIKDKRSGERKRRGNMGWKPMGRTAANF